MGLTQSDRFTATFKGFGLQTLILRRLVAIQYTVPDFIRWSQEFSEYMGGNCWTLSEADRKGLFTRTLP